MEYIGEWILPGTLGKLFLHLAFVMAGISAWFYFRSGKEEGIRLLKAGRLLFRLQLVFLILAIGLLMTLILNHRFEYMYVWQYTSRDLAFQYLISAIWAGQEGSFLIWALMQGILGLGLMARAGKWEPQAMAVYAFAQFFLLSALQGISLGFFELGNSPFVLIRQTVEDTAQSIFARPDYLQFLTDGNGMNPLLENIWMTTHPPALFLGYASVLAPFALAAAGLMRREPLAWIPSALPWVIFSILALGIGILLGGMWAYVSLTFGGFWAWDPVENASLIPWIAMVASLHLMLVARKRQQMKLATLWVTFLGYILVLYASFLTRSGILGETSVHAFGENGMLVQLLVTLAVFIAIPVLLMVRNYQALKSQAPSNPSGREFWMTAGIFIMLLSAFQIIFVTSVPVWNKIFGLNLAPPADPVGYYNKWQMPFAFLISVFMAVSGFLTYQNTPRSQWIKKVLIALTISLVLALPLWYIQFRENPAYLLFLFSSVFVTVSSAWLVVVLIRRSANPYGMVTHLGFGMFLAGVLLTFANSEVISRNTTRMNLGHMQTNAENQVLFRGDTVPMGKYMVVYSQREEKGKEVFYTLDFLLPAKDSLLKKTFTVKPSINRNEKMGYVYNPSTHSFLTRDIYTYISFAEDQPGVLKLFTEEPMKTGDSLIVEKYLMVLDSLGIEDSSPQGEIDPGNITLSAQFSLYDRLGNLKGTTQAAYVIIEGVVNHRDGQFPETGIHVSFSGISENAGTILVSVSRNKRDFIVVKAVINPYINLIWAGALITFAGLFIAALKRLNRIKKENP